MGVSCCNLKLDLEELLNSLYRKMMSTLGLKSSRVDWVLKELLVISISVTFLLLYKTP